MSPKELLAHSLPVDCYEAFLHAVARDAVLPVAVCDVEGAVVARLRECVVQLHVERVQALHGCGAGLTHTVARMLPRHRTAVIF